eukprot:CAMPEP_0117681024 /NCGR_PEP_ID=MMETSP0804-20121206/18718_1 /TAXON_ID=1074897 /ORGANISM="Tetraselmis astigmatica, Strain CCMP880" /LENGTH=39 /DNA_ID= /DNA_START= /DNA_END= /DNA_ORIENTATION=
MAPTSLAAHAVPPQYPADSGCPRGPLQVVYLDEPTTGMD